MSADNSTRQPHSARDRRIAIVVVLAVAAILSAYMLLPPSLPKPIDDHVLKSLGAPGRATGFNLLLVTLDTTRADRLGCYGYSKADTPNIDALAEKGICFERAIAPAPLTLPAHASIMTGLSPLRHEVRNNGMFRLGEHHRTLAEVLRDSGYSTSAFIGAYVLAARYGLAQGFDSYDTRLAAPRSEEGSYANERSATAVTDAALNWLENRPKGEGSPPFFAWVHYFDPHYPYEPPPEYANRFPSTRRTGDLPLYDGEIAYVDAQLGRIIAFLNASGHASRTLVVVTADHGESLYQHGEPTHGVLLYDSTIRVPLILHSPSLFHSQTVIRRRLACLTDIFPMVLDLLGIDWRQSAAVDGINVLREQREDRAVYIEAMLPRFAYGWSSLHGLCRLDDKFIEAPAPEYYDLRCDRNEQKNCFASSDAVDALRAELQRRMKSGQPPDEAIRAATALDREQIGRLSALGYIGDGPIDADQPAGTLDPKDMVELLERHNRADFLNRELQYEKALEIAESIIEDNPTDADAWQVMAESYIGLRNRDRAEACLRRSAALKPKAATLVGVAQLCLTRGGFDDAFECLKQAEALDPLEPEAFVMRGNVYYRQGEYLRAIGQYQQASALEPVGYGYRADRLIERAQDAQNRRDSE